MRENFSIQSSRQSIDGQAFQSSTKIRFFLILLLLCTLFLILIQPSLFKFLLNSSPMLWECMYQVSKL